MQDVVIIGGGAVGCAVARELSRWQLDVCLVEQGEDVCVGTSKANSAIVHAGFDAPAGSLKARFNVEGSRRMEALSRELDFPYRRNGALVLCFEEAGLPHLEELLHRGQVNGVEGLEIVRGEQLRALEPALSEKAVAALYAPSSAIICPFGMTIALAENAAHNGVTFRFDTRVERIRRTQAGYTLETNRGTMETRAVISAAGVWGDVLHNQVCSDTARIVPRRGEYCLLDKKDGGLVQRTVFQLPGPMGKGVLVTPTVHGNLLVGPTAADQEQRDLTATTAEGLAFAQDMARKSGAVLRSGHRGLSGGAGGGVSECAAEAELRPRAAGHRPPAGAALCPAAAPGRGEPRLRQHRVPLRGHQRGGDRGRHPPGPRGPVPGWGEAPGAGRYGPVPGRLLHASGHGDPGPGAGGTPDGADEKRRHIPAADRPDQGGSMMKHVQLAIIGGGPAGLAAAIAARRAGVQDLLILERDRELGGILNQCIHAGFGLHTFSQELTGPEYARRFADQVRELEIPYLLNTMVLDLSRDRVLTVTGRETGLMQISADAVILAMGCRERPRGALNIPGCRPAGIYSAGTAQRLVNMEGLMPGRDVVILGSGDIGLIMARRMTLEGAKVHAVAEVMPYSGGLKRNIVQCLEDFDIPLYLSTTVVDIHGQERLEGVTLARVDENRRPIPGTERDIPCDTLLLSVGLLPENELSQQAGVRLDAVTGGPEVGDDLSTSIPGVFACGNVLHVHDLVDFVSQEAARAGENAARYLLEQRRERQTVRLTGKNGVRYTVPQYLDPEGMEESVTVRFRVGKPYQNADLAVYADGALLRRVHKRILTPGEMEQLTLRRADLPRELAGITIQVEEVAQ